MLHGSCGRESVHSNWSDIDILMVIEEYEYKYIKEMQRIISTYSIKVGTTIYSKREFENIKVDAKTLYSIYLIRNDFIVPLFYNVNLKVPVITLNMVQDNDRRMFFEAIHKLKRLLCDSDLNKKSIIKTLTLIMKIILIRNNIIPNKYEDIFSKFAEIYNIEKYNIENDLNQEPIKEELVLYVIKVVEMISNE